VGDPHPRLGGLTAARFLAEHWQRRPLLIRSAYPDWTDPLSPDELAGLATEPDAAARLVAYEKAPPHWRVREGPFEAADFERLPETDWTLLVREVDHHLPAVAALLRDFDFLPAWRMEDVMVSYAAPGGGVGPHLDRYDVFLIQGAGRRRWQIAPPPAGEPDLVPGIDLQVLADFRPDEEWVLEPGDLLYLPPGVPHCGTAEGACMTYSVGFRAPSHPELLARFFEEAVARADPEARYADPGRAVADSPGRIDADALAWVRAAVRGACGSDAAIDRWFGRYVTGDGPAGDEAPAPPWAEVAAHLDAGGALARVPGSRWAWIDGPDGAGRVLFAGGVEHPLPAALAPLAPLLCDRERVGAADLAPLRDDPGLAPILVSLLAHGVLEAA
jgi:50S ribosomal protein L16 3-hydroxylase